jgi:uncharacterized protein (TIGR02246 family)
MACGTENKAVATPTPDRSPEVLASMEKYNQCFTQMNADCMASLFAANGEIYNTGLLKASGSDAIRGYLNQTLSTEHIDSITVTIDSIVINADVAVVRGIEEETTTDSTGEKNETKLQYVAEWIAQSNGRWLLNRISSVLAPPTQTGTP